MSTSELYCPHFREYDEDRLNRLFSKVAAVRAGDPELFHFTHRPITVYRSDEVGEESATTLTEDEILDQFSVNRHGNHAVIIEGEVGTGKSELCAYLVHQLREQGRPILRVDKDDDLMSILTERLPQFHQEHFDENLPGRDDFEQLEDDIENVSSVVANNATTGAILSFTSEGFDISTSEDVEQEIKGYVEDRLEKLVQRGEYGNRMDIISKQQYEMHDSLHIFNGSFSTEEALKKWNDALWNEIRSRYNTPPLSEMLKKVGQKFEGTRPVVVFEDFGIASIEAKQLSEYIERDIDEDNWDFIIAGTRDVTETLHTQTAEDRFPFYQTNEPNSNNVLFLDEDSAVDFIRPYLAYIKHQDGSVRYDGADGEFGRLLSPESGSRCDECGLCDSSYRDLFPFDETFLQRIYTGLDESQQSPREYVSKVFDILLEYYKGGAEAPSAANALGSDVTNPNAPADDVYDQAEEFADLSKWYGRKENGYYEIPRPFGVAFGYIDETEYDTERPAGIKVTDTVIRVPTSEGNGGTIVDPPEGGGGDDRTLVEQILDEHRGDVDDWIDDPANDRFTATNDYIRTALEDLIKHVTNGYTLWDDGSLGYNLSSQKPPFVFTNTTEEVDPDQIEIDPREFRRSEFRRLLEYGIRLEEDKSSADQEAHLERMGTQFTEYGRRWRDTIIKNQLENDKVLYQKGYRDIHDFDDFVVAAYSCLVLLDEPWKPLSAERLNDRYTADADLELDEHLDDYFKLKLSNDEYHKLIELFDNADKVESLVESRLSVTANALDVRDIRRRMEKASPYQVLDRLAKTYINNIHGRVRFGDRTSLPDMAFIVYDGFKVVENEAHEESIRGVGQFALQKLERIDMERIDTIANKLGTYDTVDPEFREAVSQFAAVDQTDVETVLEAAELAVEGLPTDVESSQAELHTELASRKLWAHPVVKRLDEIEQSWASPGEQGAGSRFEKVADHYVQ